MCHFIRSLYVFKWIRIDTFEKNPEKIVLRYSLFVEVSCDPLGSPTRNVPSLFRLFSFSWLWHNSRFLSFHAYLAFCVSWNFHVAKNDKTCDSDWPLNPAVWVRIHTVCYIKDYQVSTATFIIIIISIAMALSPRPVHLYLATCLLSNIKTLSSDTAWEMFRTINTSRSQGSLRHRSQQKKVLRPSDRLWHAKRKITFSHAIIIAGIYVSLFTWPW